MLALTEDPSARKAEKQNELLGHQTQEAIYWGKPKLFTRWTRIGKP